MIDSHVHLNRREFAAEAADVLTRARAGGVSGFLNVGYDLETSRESIALAEANPDILATVGIHPHDALLLADEQGLVTDEGNRALRTLEELAASDRVVAIGEIGLDYYRDLSPRPAQKAALSAQLALADRLELPVVLHVRDAWSETLEQIDHCGVPRRGGVLHSFSGDAAAVDWARDRGFLLGIGGPVTYKNSKLSDLVARAGVDMILLETDAPWLPPVPHRGQRNEPAYLIHTLEKVAETLGLDPGEVDRTTTESFFRLFGGPEAP
ncbi:MAG: TatD family hydrolase [Candidatus Krumholzibacteriota bacterium]